ncbi:FG-GAP repeat domain-containing protein [Streptomyces wuyuanensis]|uniref:FG-GAP repeat domain-containing protein n=1 Tax=Streptomyces wuyuanensis TaxID=1196353 RepID=UPI00344404A6
MSTGTSTCADIIRNRRTSLAAVAAVALVVGGLGLTPPAIAAAAPGEPQEVVIDLGPYQGEPARPDGIALSAGQLAVAARVDPQRERGLYLYDLAVTGTPEAGPRKTIASDVFDEYPCPEGDPRDTCTEFLSKVWGSGDGQFLFSSPWNSYQTVVDVEEPNVQQIHPVGELGQSKWVKAVDGAYVAVDEPGTGKQYIVNIARRNGPPLVHTRSRTAVAIWGSKIWKPGTGTGTVNSYDLETKANSPEVKLGSGCRPDELQSVGRWLHWSCGDHRKAGVWDHATGRNIPVAFGDDVQLGDGFLVRAGSVKGTLLLTDFHKGGGTAAVTSTFANGVDTWPGLWSVDRYGGHVAFADTSGRIHVKPVTVPRSPLSVVHSTTQPSVSALRWPWRAEWRFSRPTASRTFAVRDAYGRLFDEGTSTERTGALVRATWDESDMGPRWPVSGVYSWTVGARPADGAAEAARLEGTLRLVDGWAAYRDASNDGYGEYYSMTTTGKVAVHHLAGGTRSWATTGWDPRTLVIPYGSNTGDEPRSDVLLRTPDGNLYRAPGTNPIDPARPHHLMGKGWQGFDAITYSPDFTGDGRPDLFARQASTGFLFLYRGSNRAGLDPAVKVGSGWKGWTVIGAADLTGDGHGDLLARDAGGEVWRYDGTGTGTFKPRRLVFSDWGAGRKEIVVVGDITGDGIPDLLSRDTNGKLLRNKGDGKGLFGATVTVGTGWQHYRSLF